MRLAPYALVRRALFRLDPEVAHRGALRLAELAERALRLGAGIGATDAGSPRPRLEQEILGRRFPNPIGLAAGFDKNAIAPHLWPRLGFGFAELGTVTAKPQSGNPLPRLFRLPEDRALINRLGFNNDGAVAVTARLDGTLTQRPTVPIGLNIGASRSSLGDPRAEVHDYRESAQRLGCHADYVAINVSSPNSPGLRDLQAPHRLEEIVEAVGEGLANHPAGDGPPPILVKLSPDIAPEDVGDMCRAALAGGARGFIAVNTTLSRAALTSPRREEAGGLSGAPLRQVSNRIIERIRREIGPDLPIIGIGGVSTLADVVAKFEAGANLVALYSSLIFEGPLVARRLARELDAYLEARGLASVAQLGDASTPAGSARVVP